MDIKSLEVGCCWNQPSSGSCRISSASLRRMWSTFNLKHKTKSNILKLVTRSASHVPHYVLDFRPLKPLNRIHSAGRYAPEAVTSHMNQPKSNLYKLCFQTIIWVKHINRYWTLATTGAYVLIKFRYFLEPLYFW